MVTAPTIVYSRYAQGGNTTFACGKITVSADGGSTAISLILGFVPSYFRLFNATVIEEIEWFAGMTSANYIKHLGSDGVITFETSGGPAVISSGTAGYGMTIPAALIANDEVLYFEARP